MYSYCSVVLEFLMLTEHLKRIGFLSNGLIYLLLMVYLLLFLVRI